MLGCSGDSVDTTTDDRFKEILAKQLDWNKATFARLQELGLTPESQVRLDFFYYAPSEDSAKALAALIESETDYDVTAQYLKEPTPTWSVTGSTQPTVITLDILDQWVSWMVAAGQRHDCEFDGWGTEI